MKFNLNLTTRTRLIASFFLMAMIPMGLLALVNNKNTREALIEDANQALFAVASQTAASLDTFISTNLEAINTEAHLPTVVDYIKQFPNGKQDSIEEQEAIILLSTLSEKNPFITSYALLNKEGIVLIDSDTTEMKADKSDRDYFLFYMSAHDSATFVSPVQFSQSTEEASLYFSSSIIDADGNELGVLRVRYSADILQSLLEEKNNVAGIGSFGVLFDEHHLHLAHGVEPGVNFIPIIRFDDQTETDLRASSRLPDLFEEELYIMQLDDLEMHLSNPETLRFFEAEDVATGDLINQVAIAELGTQPWLVAFFQPQEIFLSPVVTQTQNTALLVVIFSILAVVVAFLVGQLIGRPITDLTNTVTQFTSGNRDVRSDIQSGDEIGILARNYNKMADSVQSLFTGLEERAEELEEEISERKRIEGALRFSEERYRSISDLTSDYIYSVTIKENNDLELDWSTDAFYRFTGYNPEELASIGGWPTLVHPDDQKRFEEERNSLILSSESDVVEYRIVTKKGETRWLRDFRRINRDDSGRPAQMIGAAQDITRHKERDAELEGARDSAEMANRAKGAFLANMSHELRTPLNAILGFSQLMSNHPNLDPEQKDHLGIINRSGEHLLTLINDVLEMSKIEAGRTTLQLNSFDLHKLLDEVEDMLNLRAMNNGLRLLVEKAEGTPQYIQADEGKLRQILINLISNAIKFTKEGGVSIRVRHYESSGSHRLAFEIEDSGPGIAEEDLETLFDAFVQTRQGTTFKEGTGLGLSISREFVRLMGGDIHVSSEIGRGSIFKFDVEVALAEASNVPVEQPARQVVGLAPNQPMYRILIVDDQEENRKLLVSLLEPLGFDVREAVNGLEAVNMWRSWDPHLIWMDMRMPVLDGYKATNRIRSLPNGGDPVIIALTASAFEENRAMSLEAGAYDFVRKPFRNEEIYERIAKHLEIKFMYKDEETDTSPSIVIERQEKLTAQDLVSLPESWKSELHTAAAQADADRIMELIEQVKFQYPDLTNTLVTLVNNFRFDILMEITQKVGV